MSWVKCLGCNGVYPTKQIDGGLYFHACPPGTPPASARNENVPSTAASDAKNIIAAGAGVQATAAPPGAPPGLAAL